MEGIYIIFHWGLSSEGIFSFKHRIVLSRKNLKSSSTVVSWTRVRQSKFSSHRPSSCLHTRHGSTGKVTVDHPLELPNHFGEHILISCFVVSDDGGILIINFVVRYLADFKVTETVLSCKENILRCYLVFVVEGHRCDCHCGGWLAVSSVLLPRRDFARTLQVVREGDFNGWHGGSYCSW